MKKHIIKILAITAHAAFMLGLTLAYMASHFSLEDEVILIKASSGAKNLLFQPSDTLDHDRFLFVNVAWQKKLAPYTDPQGMPVGSVAITDRKDLAHFLRRLQAASQHTFLFIDISFETPSEDDSLLQAAFDDTQRYLVSYHKDEDDRPIYPILDVPLGLSDMETEEGALLLKYHMVQGDSLKTTPLKMYERIHGKAYHEGNYLYDFIGGTPVLNHFILDFRISSFHKQNYAYLHLGEFLDLPDFLIADMVKDKIVVVGDFEDKDMHKTIYGMLPGSFILINALLALERGDNVLSIYFVLWLFVAFSFISFKALVPQNPVNAYIQRKFKNSFIVPFFKDMLFYVFYFGLVSLVSYFWFGVHLAILILSFYMYGLEQFINFLNKKLLRRKREPFIH